jgi:hypothetical protein
VGGEGIQGGAQKLLRIPQLALPAVSFHCIAQHPGQVVGGELALDEIVLGTLRQCIETGLIVVVPGEHHDGRIRRTAATVSPFRCRCCRAAPGPTRSGPPGFRARKARASLTHSAQWMLKSQAASRLSISWMSIASPGLSSSSSRVSGFLHCFSPSGRQHHDADPEVLDRLDHLDELVKSMGLVM